MVPHKVQCTVLGARGKSRRSGHGLNHQRTHDLLGDVLQYLDNARQNIVGVMREESSTSR
jgi:hypothetical protein